MSDLNVSKRESIAPYTNPTVLMAIAGRQIHKYSEEITQLKMASVAKPLGKYDASQLERLTRLVANHRAYIDGYLGQMRKMQNA